MFQTTRLPRLATFCVGFAWLAILQSCASSPTIHDRPIPFSSSRQKATLDYIRPALQADGGDIVLNGVEDGVVSLEMVGACGGCPLSLMTVKAGIERILVDRVPGVVSVDAK